MDMRRFEQVLVGTMLCGLCSTVAGATDQAQPSSYKAPASTTTASPSLASVEGTITALHLKETMPSLELKDAAGKTWTMQTDPKHVSIWHNGSLVKSEQLVIGQHVKARYVEQGGKLLTRSIHIVSAKSETSTAAPATSSH